MKHFPVFVVLLSENSSKNCFLQKEPRETTDLIKILDVQPKKIVMMKNLLVAGLASLIVLSTSCEKKENQSSQGNGRLKVSITDSPLPLDFIESATVTVIQGKIRSTGSEDQEAAFNTFFEDTATFDLMDLQNGVTSELADIEIPAGSYDEVRLIVSSASITLKDGAVYDVKVPSGSSSGLKIKVHPPIVVEGGLTSELVLDFDVSRSFVLKGNMNTPAGIKGFNFKPVVRSVNVSTAGRLEGMVSDTSDTVIPNASVWLEKDTVVASSQTDSTGYYNIIAVPAGEYDVYATGENYDTVTVSGVMIHAANSTRQDFVLTPVDTASVK